jgi:phosphate transport system protein
MMHRFFDDDLSSLKQQLIKMALTVEEALEKAMLALFDRNDSLAAEVMEQEKKINQFEIDIDEAGRRFTALKHPVATDLRVVGTILKINTDLERMGDHAVNIAEKSVYVNREPRVAADLKFQEMFSMVRLMLSDAINAFMLGDAKLAASVISRDDVVDDYDEALYEKLGEVIRRDPALSKACLNLLMLGHNLERVADLACNIAEDVIYMKKGEEVRHRSKAINAP